MPIFSLELFRKSVLIRNLMVPLCEIGVNHIKVVHSVSGVNLESCRGSRNWSHIKEADVDFRV